MKRMVLIGDSIRMGYQDTVEKSLEGRAKILRPEENGGNSGRVLDNLDAWVIAHDPDVVHLNCGLHDLRREFGAENGAIPLAEYEKNVRQILSRLKSETNADLVWATTTPVDQDLHHANKGFDRFEEDVREYNRIAVAVAGEMDVAVNDLYSVIDSAGKSRYLLNDGVHFTPEGYTLLGEKVVDFLSRFV